VKTSDRSATVRYGAAILLVAVAALLRLGLANVLPSRFSFTTFFLAAIIASLLGGFGPGIVATALGAAVGTLILTHGTFVFPEASDPSALVLFCVLSSCFAIAFGAQRNTALKANKSAKEAQDAQAAMIENERLATKRLAELEIVYDTSPVGLCFLDPELRFVRINERLAQINHLSAEDHVGKTPQELFGEQSREVVDVCNQVLQTRTPVRDRQIEMLIDGETRYFAGNYDPVFAKDGSPLGVNIVVEETTEQRRAQIRNNLLGEATRTLNSSLDYEKTLLQVCDSVVPDFADWCAVDLLDEVGSIKRLGVKHIDPNKVKWAWELNEKFPPDPKAPTGVPAVIRSGQSEVIKDVTPEIIEAANLDEELLKIVEQIGFSSVVTVPISARGRVLGALTLVWAESKHHYSNEDVSIAEELGRRAGIAIDNAQLFLSAQREIRERKVAEDQVRRLNSELERRVQERTAELREAMDDLEGFCYNVSHDLRAPMRSLSGNSKMLLEDFGQQLSGDAKDHLQRINLAASKMGELVDDLLQFSRLGRTHLAFRSVNLSELAEAAATAYKSQNPESKALVVIQPGLVTCGDPNVLALAIQNLFDNALKYSSKIPTPKVEFGAKQRGEETIFFVKDNGVGFDMKYAPKIFEPFQRLHRDAEYPGTGIGLANVRRVINRHGGHIWVEAVPGQGATFYFTITARCNDESAPLTSAAPPYLG